MPDTFAELSALLETDPSAYREKISRMRTEDPARLARFIEHMRTEIERAHEHEDRPMTEAEVKVLIEHTAEALQWPRRRVLAEALLRLREVAVYGPPERFRPLTPPETQAERKGRYARRFSSVQALVLGDVKAGLRAIESTSSTRMRVVKPTD